MRILGTSTGWLIVALIAVTALLPYLVRRRRRTLTPHFWIGYLIAGATLVHAVLAMSAPLPAPLRTGFLAGLWIATGAGVLAFVQVLVGRSLRQRGRADADRWRLRRWHLTVMAALVLGGAVHVVLNGPVSI